MALSVDRWRRGALALSLALATVAAPAATAQASVHHQTAASKTTATKTAAAARTAKRKPASSPTPAPALCAQGSSDQPFLAEGDFNYYVPMPGPTATGFDGSAWGLTGAATVSGQNLNLPAGSHAVSPDVCITSQDPEARVMVRSVYGGDNVQVNVSYYTSAGWTAPQPAGGVNGQGTGWTLSSTINLPHPPPSPPGSAASDWQIVRFTFTPGGGDSDFQLSNLQIAVPPPTPSTGPCSTPVLSQAFLPAGDTNLYTPAPGQTGGGFVGTGWTLAGGAKIVTATRASGASGKVLDLPGGSIAISPNICVTSLYPTARMMARSLLGGGDLSFRVSYLGTNTWTQPRETGHVHADTTSWTLSDPMQLQPSNHVKGWQIMRLTLVPNGPKSEFQLYDLELDPYAKG